MVLRVALGVIVMMALTSMVTGCRSRAAAPPAPKTAALAGREACAACRGVWAVHGLDDKESCNCRTTDAGKRCTDGSDCQGMCMADGDNLQTEIVTPGPPARGFFIGRCSELVTVFGCHRVIERGARARGPVLVDEPLPTICTD